MCEIHTVMGTCGNRYAGQKTMKIIQTADNGGLDRVVTADMVQRGQILDII